MNIQVEIPDDAFTFYSIYLKARGLSWGEYIGLLLRDDLNAIFESLEPSDIQVMFSLPSSLKFRLETD
ncbi:MAG: hypothetical protein LYZ69_09370 [Nitrososphaerales archaeon]|nr:hypothetical protein [Nitrososphaerales archaeon]